MASYNISDKAQADLIRIHQHGMQYFGTARADDYYWAFFEQFEKIVAHPHLYPAVERIPIQTIIAVCAALTAFIIASMTTAISTSSPY